MEVDEEEAGVPGEPRLRVAAEAGFVIPDEARLEVARDENIRRGRDRLAENGGAVSLRDVGVGIDLRGEVVLRAEAEERDEVVVRLVGQGFAGAGFGHVDCFINALPDALEAHGRHDREVADGEAVFGEDRVIPVGAVALVAGHAGGGPRGAAALVGAGREGVEEEHTTGEGVGVAEPFPVVADARLEAEGVELLVFDLVRVGVLAGG